MSRCLLPLLLVTLAGCASVTPRFPQNVQASFARDDMRKLTTRSLELYYPAHLRPAALRIAARVEACAERLRKLTHSQGERERLLLYLTSADFNNAYVSSGVYGYPQQMVMPHQVTLELFNLLGFGTSELGGVGCHEAVHYVQMEQVEGLWKALNTVTGSLYQPNVFTESWFLEGLATWYEGRLEGEQGRPHSPLWRGVYSAMVQAHGGRLHAGYLSPAHRDVEPLGGNYLTGMHFVEWLADTYGEDKLWSLVELQAHSILSPVGVSLRFERVYGRTLNLLFDQYTRVLRQRHVPRHRPPSQQVLAEEVGLFARLAVSPKDGALATVGDRRDEPVRLVIRERDGQVRFSRSLLEPLPGRRWIAFHPLVMSGLTFTPEGDFLYLVAADIGEDGSYTGRLWKVDARTGEVVRTWEGVEGMGGSLSPDGRGYVYVGVEGDTANLVRLDLESGEHQPLTRFEDRRSLGTPAVSPEGSRIAFTLRTERGWNLALLEPGGQVRLLTDDGHFNYAPRWVDEDRLVLLREHEGRWQAWQLTLSRNELVRLTDVPHLAMDVAPQGEGHLAFLNREGINFSLDRAPLQPLGAPELALVVEPPPSPALASGGDSAASASSAESPGPAEPLPLLERKLEILSETPYPALDGFFSPVLRVPYAYALPQGSRFVFFGGASLLGQDRLGHHQYGLLVQYDTGTREPSAAVAYGNAQLAPWYLELSASRSVVPGRRDLEARLTASRSFWSTPVALSLLAQRRDWYSTAERPGVSTSLLGPEAALAWSAGESSSYGGTQRGLSLAFAAGLYPGAFSSTNTLGDLRGDVQAFLPGLPVLTHDNLQLGLTARFLPGAPEGLLQVGGVQLGAPLYSLRSGPESTYELPLGLRPGTSFAEPLRGYEDFALGARNVVVASARYRYRFVIDYGLASLAYVAPSLFISQVELDAFGTWARTDLRANHRAAGASLTVRTVLGQQIPLSFYYQFAARFDDGLGPLHLVGISL